MPTWKKIIVSGSQAELAAVTASIAVLVGTNQQITTAQSTTFLTGSFTGSFRGDGSALTGVTGVSFPTTQLTPIVGATQVFISDGVNKYATVSQFNSSSWAGVSGDITINGTTGVATLKANIISSSAQIFSGGTITGGASLQLTGSSSSLTGSFTGSFTGLHSGNGSGLTNIPYTGVTFAGSGFVSASTLSSNSQGTVTSSINGVAQNVNLGLTPTDTPTFASIATNATTFNVATSNATTINIGNAAASVFIPGNLFVQGPVTAVSSSQLYIADQFILLASGSAGNSDGGIIVDRGSGSAGNIAYGYDVATTRWGYQNGLSDTINLIDPTSNSGVSGAFAGYVFTEGSHGTTKPVTGEFAAQGAIYSANNGDIWIYSGS